MTCHIWKSAPLPPLPLSHYEKIFTSIGSSPYWVTISGGQPTLHPDLPSLIHTLISICHPKVITIPTNGITPTHDLALLRDLPALYPDVTFKINISLDGTHDVHDFIRGTPGNFSSALDLFHSLTYLSYTRPNLIPGFYTVVSKYNYDRLPALLSFLDQIHPLSYGLEPAQYRPLEMNNDPDLLPPACDLANALEEVLPALQKYTHSQHGIPTLRAAYYNFLITVLRTGKMPIQCMAGHSSIHISPSGEVWSCCTAPYSLGNLSSTNYDLADFLRLAQPKIKSLHQSGCSCLMSNAFFSSYICSFRNLLSSLNEVIPL